MPNWTNRVPEQKKHMGFDLQRTPEATPLVAIVTCDDLLGCDTHYWGGRTMPCERPDCAACNAAMPYRWHCYVSCYSEKTHVHFIFECTANAAKAFEDYRKAHGTLRGCKFQAQRPKAKKNAKVIIATKPANLTDLTLPQPPDLMLALAVIWKLPGAAMRKEYSNTGKTRIRTRSGVLREMREQPDNQPETPTVGDVLKIASNGHGEPTPCAAG